MRFWVTRLPIFMLCYHIYWTKFWSVHVRLRNIYYISVIWPVIKLLAYMNHTYTKFFLLREAIINTRYLGLTLWEHRMYGIWENIARFAFFSRVLRVYRHANLKTFYSQVRSYKPLRQSRMQPSYLFSRFPLSRVVISHYKFQGSIPSVLPLVFKTFIIRLYKIHRETSNLSVSDQCSLKLIV